jgi:hypothetical protein
VDREGDRTTASQAVKSGSYLVRRSADGGTYTVEAGERSFLVVVAFGRTLVFQRISRPDGYVTRREILHEMDPELAVTGYVLSFDTTHDPVLKLKTELDRQQKSYWSLHKELTRVRAELERSKKRGKHGRRNS